MTEIHDETITTSGSPASAALAAVDKLGFVEMRTPDVEAMVSHYVDVLSFEVTGREGSTVYLTTGPDHHCLVVTAGEAHGRSAIGLSLSGSLDEAQQRLAAAGIESERRHDPQPGIAQALVVPELTTDVPIFLYESMASVDVKPTFGPRPTKLGHVAAFTPDMPAVQRFYLDVLGFRWSDTIANFFTFLRCNADHHAVNFMESAKDTGLHHIAYEARDIVHLRDIVDNLAQNGVRLYWGLGRHGPGHNIFGYHEDPDGNTIEMFTEIDQVLDERNPQWEPRPWHEEHPMGPKHWPLEDITANQWGPMHRAQLDH